MCHHVGRLTARGLLAALTAATMGIAAAYDGSWHTGRATHYGGNGDPWSIHKGHCGYGYLDPNVGTGWDICAPSDMNWDYDASTSSCGVCYEVACQDMKFNDFYGNYLDRQGVCYDQGASVIMMVTDVCPCYYPSNAYSNKRWCCGDMQHFDVSTFAFEKLADIKWGVIGIKYRRVACDFSPDKRAYRPQSANAAWDSTPQPWGWSKDMDKRNAIWSSVSSGGSSASASAIASASGSGSASASASASASSEGGLTSSWSVTTSTSSSSSWTSSSASTVSNIYYGGLMQGWNDESWGLSKWGRDSSLGFDGQQALCSTLSGYGAVDMSGWQGAFSSKRFVEFWTKRFDGSTPDVTLHLASSQASCKGQSLRGYQPQEYKGEWVRYLVPLDAFDWRIGSATGNGFSGCSDQMSDWVVDKLQFQNNWGGDQHFCVDQVKTW